MSFKLLGFKICIFIDLVIVIYWVWIFLFCVFKEYILEDKIIICLMFFLVNCLNKLILCEVWV